MNGSAVGSIYLPFSQLVNLITAPSCGNIDLYHASRGERTHLTPNCDLFLIFSFFYNWTQPLVWQSLISVYTVECLKFPPLSSTYGCTPLQ